MHDLNDQRAPIFDKLKQFKQRNTISFHVLGHKSGKVFSDQGIELFSSILPIDLTELTGLDDLHAPNEVIEDAQHLASKWFGAEETYFLVGGSTVGNLAMVLATCNPGDKVIVQRNCHKSIINGLELSGATPIFIAPEFDERVMRYTSPSIEVLLEVIRSNPDAKAVVVTYPDYFGQTFKLKEVVEEAHRFNIPVLVDEAHGVHFHLSEMFPQQALDIGADIVVQSAHKTAPAMTMASYLHVKSTIVDSEKVKKYLQMVQSSSPSYPLLASLDLARHFLAGLTETDLLAIIASVEKVRTCFLDSDFWTVIPSLYQVDDPLKITLQLKEGLNGSKVSQLFEKENIYPELSTNNQLLFIHGLAPFNEWNRLKNTIEKVNIQLKTIDNHATIEVDKKLYEGNIISTLVYSYQEMKQMKRSRLPWEKAIGQVAAEAIIPYPPGIPLLIEGEKVTAQHIKVIHHLLKQGIRFQNSNIHHGIAVFI